MGEYADKIKIGPPRLTRFERARILGARALQLSMGASPLISIEELSRRDPLSIAREELSLGILPITVKRMLPSGEHQIIPLKWLLEAEREIYRWSLKQ